MTYLQTDDTVDQAITIMHINFVKHLPVIQNGKLLAVVSEEDLLRSDSNASIKSIIKVDVKPITSNSEDHLFDVLTKIADHNLSSIPVVDKDENYQGLVSQQDLIQFYANSFSFKEPGSILVLEMSRRSYSLAEISRLVEQESAAILSTFLTDVPDSTNILVTLKINRQEVSSIIKTFERFEYTIKASFTESEYLDDLKERYDMLMSYLNV